MLSNVLVDDTAYIRCISTSGSKSVVGEVIPITVEEYNPQEMMLMMADSAASDGVATVAEEPTYFYITVKYVFENNLMQGTGNGFEPERKMSRAMLVTVLYRMANLMVFDLKILLFFESKPYKKRFLFFCSF